MTAPLGPDSGVRAEALRQLGGTGIALAAAVTFSIAVVCARITYDEGGNAPTVLALRYAFAATVLFTFLRVTGRRTRLAAPLTVMAVGIGLLMSIYASSYLTSVQFIPVSLAVLIFYLNPLLIGVGAWLVDREPITPTKGAALALGFIGVALALRVELGSLDPRGLALGAVAATFLAVTSLVSRRVLKRIDSVTLTFYANLVAATLFTVGGAATGAFDAPGSERGMMALAAVPLFFTVGITCFFTAVSIAGPVRTATIMNSEPVATVLLAVLILGESLTLVQYLGAALVVAALFLIRRPDRPAPAIE